MANHGGVPVRPATATAVAPTLAEGQLAILSTDLTGALRTTSSGGAGGGTSAADEAAFVEGTTPGTPEMGVYHDSLAAVTTGKVAVTRIGKFRSILATLWSGSANNEVGTLANPVRTDTTGTTPQPVSGTVSIVGTKTNNNAAPSITIQEAMTCLANAAIPSWTEGNEVLLDVDLKGSLRTRQTGSGFTATQVSVGNTATLLSALNSARTRITITNAGTTAVYLGASGVTTSTGALLAGIVGYPVLYRTTAAIYGIVASGTQTVTVFEETT